MPKDVARRPYLHQPKDRSSWIFRAAIPERLRAVSGGLREFKRVLGPTYAEALERYDAIAHEWTALRARLNELAGSESAGQASSYVPVPMHVPQAKPASRSVYALNALGDYLRTTLEVRDPLLVTYSFRHTVIDEARSAEVPQEDRDALLGHQEGDNRQKNSGELFYGARW